jgi:hypothetical protein
LSLTSIVCSVTYTHYLHSLLRRFGSREPGSECIFTRMGPIGSAESGAGGVLVHTFMVKRILNAIRKWGVLIESSRQAVLARRRKLRGPLVISRRSNSSIAGDLNKRKPSVTNHVSEYTFLFQQCGSATLFSSPASVLGRRIAHNRAMALSVPECSLSRIFSGF